MDNLIDFVEAKQRILDARMVAENEFLDINLIPRAEEPQDPMQRMRLLLKEFAL